MRLDDLDAQFIRWSDVQSPYSHRTVLSISEAEGVLFQCPLCAVGKKPGREDGRGYVEGAHYVLCWFANPQSGRVAPQELDAENKRHPRWVASGTGIADLTLSPSVSLDVPENHSGCRWHGYVQGGEAR